MAAICRNQTAILYNNLSSNDVSVKFCWKMLVERDIFTKEQALMRQKNSFSHVITIHKTISPSNAFYYNNW